MVGPYTTTFSLTSTGVLLWTNPNFSNGGGARFCILDADGNVYVVFQADYPPDCSPINVNVVEGRISPFPSNCAVA
jgi:hypothetical protein